MVRKVDLRGIEESKKPIFYCSFGKDSSVILHALKSYLEKTMVVFVDCGGLYPDISEWAQKHGSQLPKFQYLNAPGDIWDEIRQKGWPTDIEVEDLGELSERLFLDELALTHRVRLWTKCTHDRVWLPSYVYSQMYRPDLFISGEKKLDRPFAPDSDWEGRNMGAPNTLRPLFDWSDEDVWEYIDYHGIELTKTFQGRQADRRDCFVCFGHHLTPGRVEYLKTEFPELYQDVFIEKGFGKVVSAMVKHLNRSLGVWAEIEKNLS